MRCKCADHWILFSSVFRKCGATLCTVYKMNMSMKVLIIMESCWWTEPKRKFVINFKTIYRAQCQHHQDRNSTSENGHFPPKDHIRWMLYAMISILCVSMAAFFPAICCLHVYERKENSIAFNLLEFQSNDIIYLACRVSHSLQTY